MGEVDSGAETLALVDFVGADSKSVAFYHARVKGEIEENSISPSVFCASLHSSTGTIVGISE